jgi:hypothetical protein
MKYIISGLAPGESGIGRVMQYIIQNAGNAKVIYPSTKSSFSFKKSLVTKKWIEALTILAARLFDYIYFPVRLFGINNKDVVIIHPQKLGFRNAERLIRNNRAAIYIMDNSFFCVKSYNHIAGETTACIRCLSGHFENAKAFGCMPYPSRYSLKRNIQFLNFLFAQSSNILFYYQNSEQLSLLRKHFGNIRTARLGLLTSDMFHENHFGSDCTEKFDVVFHGANVRAKGVEYTLQLAKNLPQYRFLFPFIGKSSLTNVYYEDVTWATGLKDRILNASITLCPSVWSAPIEGSVIKTLQLGVPTGLLNAQYSFATEIPDSIALKLTGDITLDVNLLSDVLEGKKEIDVQGAKTWVESFVDVMRLDFDRNIKVPI